MDKLFLLICCFFLLNQAHAQFAGTPQTISQSVRTNQLGIWTADIDGDGAKDILVPHSSSLIWYKNLGGGTFSDDKELFSVKMSNSIGFLGGRFQDIDGDGLPDLIFDLYWRKGLGNGEYAPQTSILLNSLATLCDVDSDGLPDAITRDDSRIYWQRNLGSGNFGPRIIISNVSFPNVYNFDVDLNSDGKQDFIARHNNTCFWYKNLGNSQFEAVQFSPAIPRVLTIGNIDNNGKPDLITGHDGNIYWYEFDTDGQQTLKQTLPQYHRDGVSLGDLDDDEDQDLFVGAVGNSNGSRAKYFAFDETTGLFDPVPKNHNSYLQTHEFSEILDLNGDGHPDILTGAVVGGPRLGWLRNLGPGSFTTFINLDQKMALPQAIEIADLENDGDMDIFTSGFVFENLGNGQYAEKRRASPGTGSKSFYGDLDGDGIKDLALPQGDRIAWQKGLGNGQFGPSQTLDGLVTSCKQVGGADLDGDGDLDLFAANGTESTVENARFYWFENDGSGNFTAHLLATGIQFCSEIFALDANEDNLVDIGMLFFASYSPKLYLNLGGGNFAPPTGLFSAGTLSPSRVNQDLFTDLDGDGKIDYVYCTRDYTRTIVAWYQNLGTEGFSSEQTLLTMNHPAWSTPYFCVFDVDMDGLNDVVISDNHSNRFSLIRGLGNATFAAATTMYQEPNFGNLHALAAHDVDGDGKLDIVFGNNSIYPGDLNAYDRLSWIKNLYPEPAPGLRLVINNSICDDNGTPLDATDDRQVLRFKIAPIGNTTLSDRFLLYDELTQTALDTFFYDRINFYSFPSGSAGIFTTGTYSFRDLMNPNLKREFHRQSTASCSPDAPTGIGINHLKVSCDDSFTPADPSDDRIKIEIDAAIYNDTTSTYSYTINSDLGTPQHIDFGWNEGQYQFPEIYFLPEGSANAGGQITITIQDQMNIGIIKTFVFDNPGTCVSHPPTCPAEIHYTKQNQIDLFPTTYPNCKVIEGSVKISIGPLPGAERIQNLHGFSHLEYIHGDFIIEETNISDLTGLESLKIVGGDLLIFGNQELQNLEGLNNLEEIVKSLSVYHCSSLSSLSGLDSLSQIGSDLHLRFATVLTDMSSLQKLENINGSIVLQGLDSLRSLQGLDSIKNIGTADDNFSGLLGIVDCHSLENLNHLSGLKSLSNLQIWDNGQLKTLSGLQNLDTIRTELSILQNPALENLDALSNVSSSLKAFFIIDNDKLTHLDGIRNMNLLSLIIIEISGSESLSGCSQPNICAYLDLGKFAFVEFNKFGCNSMNEIKTVCQVPLTAYLEGSTEICLGDSTELVITFEGIAPYTFTLAENGAPLPAVVTSDNPYLIEVSPDIQSTYSLVNVSNELGSGLTGGSALIEIKECTVGISSWGNDNEAGNFQVFPNPLSKDDLLQISLENEYIGELKIEFSSLDGRVLKSVFAKKDKSIFSEHFRIDAAWPGQFIVRVTDRERSGARLVMRF